MLRPCFAKHSFSPARLLYRHLPACLFRLLFQSVFGHFLHVSKLFAAAHHYTLQTVSALIDNFLGLIRSGPELTSKISRSPTSS
jgi:hypothetical protein